MTGKLVRKLYESATEMEIYRRGSRFCSGELHNNFSMNEADDCLRIVTTVEGWDKDYSNFSRSNGLYVLNEKLKTIGKIEDLAEGEQIKAARFMGDTGYFVTYRNTDPLFAADLSGSEEPRDYEPN